MDKSVFKMPIKILFFGFLFVVSAENIYSQNLVNGLIFDRNKTPVADIEVELLDEYERLIRTTKTSNAGIYIFQGLRAGNYYIQIRVDGTNYKSAKERFQIGQTNFTNSTTGQLSGSETLQLNLVLEVDARRNNNQTPLNNEVVFAQNVPEEAKASYEKALKNFNDKKQKEGIALLQSAIEIFPEYFLALDRLVFVSIEK